MAEIYSIYSRENNWKENISNDVKTSKKIQRETLKKS